MAKDKNFAKFVKELRVTVSEDSQDEILINESSIIIANYKGIEVVFDRGTDEVVSVSMIVPGFLSIHINKDIIGKHGIVNAIMMITEFSKSMLKDDTDAMEDLEISEELLEAHINSELLAHIQGLDLS